jgi:ABC-type lipoprotein release transport system permease subunit
MSRYVGGGSNEIILLSRGSSTPFTGIIDLNILDNLSRVDGVRYFSPELPILVYLNGSPVVLRGVIPSIFVGSIDLEVLDGYFLDDFDYAYVVVGRRVSEYYSLSVGDKVVLTGLFGEAFHMLVVKGIVDIPEPYDSEVIVNIGLARVFRGISGNYSSMIRIGVEDGSLSIVRDRVMSLIGGEDGKGGLVLRSEEVLGYYLRKFGFDPSTLFVAIIPSIVVSIVLVKYLVGGFIEEHLDHIEVLHEIGFSYRDIRLNYIIQFVMYLIAAIFLGYLVGIIVLDYLWSSFYIRFLIHIPLLSTPLYIFPGILGLFLLLPVYFMVIGWRIDGEE